MRSINCKNNTGDDVVPVCSLGRKAARSYCLMNLCPQKELIQPLVTLVVKARPEPRQQASPPVAVRRCAPCERNRRGEGKK